MTSSPKPIKNSYVPSIHPSALHKLINDDPYVYLNRLVCGCDLLVFVASKRSAVVLRYNVSVSTAPMFLQALPSVPEVEGLTYDTVTGVLPVASELDSRHDQVQLFITRFNLERHVLPKHPNRPLS